MADKERKLEMFQIPTGTKGFLYIQDDSGYVSLGIYCTDPTFTKSGLSFSWKSPTGKGSKKNFTLAPGGALQNVATFSAPLSGDITLTLNATGTSELGGKTTLTHKLSRSKSKPFPPRVTALYPTSNTAAKFHWEVRATGGTDQKITRFDVAVSDSVNKVGTITTNASSPSEYKGAYTKTGLAVAKLYYFRVRAVNKEGVGEWSDPRGVITRGGVMVRYNNEWRYAIPYVRTDKKWARAEAYTKKTIGWERTR